MSGFGRVGGAIHCDGVPAERIAREAGTPAYVYSATTIRERYERLDRALAAAPHRIHYSVKANGCRGVLEVLRAAGAGVDVVSGGELFRALRAGFRGEDIVFGGVGNLWGTLVGAFSLGIANKFLEPYAGAVVAKIAILVLIILFIQKRPRGLFALKGRAVEA